MHVTYLFPSHAFIAVQTSWPGVNHVSGNLMRGHKTELLQRDGALVANFSFKVLAQTVLRLEP